MQQYLNVVEHVLQHGERKVSRTGIDTLSTFNINYEIDLRDGFPLLTTKEISWKNIIVENLWFLSGQRHIGLLRRHGCHFWDPWADDQGYVPSAYGNLWRQFPFHSEGRLDHADQIRWVLDEISRNPNSRRLVVSAWAPGNAHDSALPPCHAFWVLNVQTDKQNQPTLCLHLTQRSCDVALGLPYNIAGYAFLLELFSRLSGIPVGRFAHTLIDAHVYTAKPDGDKSDYDHIPGLRQQLERSPRPLPTLAIDPTIRSLSDIEQLFEASTEDLLATFALSGYAPHPAIQFKVAV